MKISVEIKGATALRLVANGAKQIPFAVSRAINEVAKKVVEAESKHIASVFKGPTHRTLNAVKVFKGATKDRLEAEVGIDDGLGRKTVKSMGKKGTVPPAKYLLPQIEGGPRVPKRFELALQAIGAMPKGMQAVFAQRSNALDQHGNLSGAKIVQIISYFRTTKAEGYGGKMTKARKEKMAKGELKGMKWGVAYFRGGKQAGLPDGIWERHYPNGMAGKSFIRPILIYIEGSNYDPRFLFHEVAKQSIDSEWQPAFDKWARIALETAR